MCPFVWTPSTSSQVNVTQPSLHLSPSWYHIDTTSVLQHGHRHTLACRPPASQDLGSLTAQQLPTYSVTQQYQQQVLPAFIRTVGSSSPSNTCNSSNLIPCLVSNCRLCSPTLCRRITRDFSKTRRGVDIGRTFISRGPQVQRLVIISANQHRDDTRPVTTQTTSISSTFQTSR